MLDFEEMVKQLSVAIRLHNLTAISILFDKLIDAEQQFLIQSFRDDGHTLMHWAAKVGIIEVLDMLKQAGCSFELQSSDSVGMFPIHWACIEGNLEVVKWLRIHGVNLNCRDLKGCTPVIIAAQNGFVEIALYLIKAGARLDILDENGDSALHWASYKGHTAAIVMLISLGENVNDVDAHGQGPIHLASLRGNLDAVEYLVLEAKADVNAKDRYGKTPLDLSVTKKMIDVEFFFRSQNNKGMKIFGLMGEFLKRPQLVKAFCQMGQGPQGAVWPFFFNIFCMFGIGATAVHKFFNPKFLFSTYGSILVTATIVGYILLWGLFITVYLSEPGYIYSAQNQKLSLAFKNRIENLLDDSENKSKDKEASEPTILQGTLCYTCSIERPLRSKHCRVCKRCVRNFDHHCSFVRNCIGLKNYGFFYLYVWTLFIGCFLYLGVCLTWLSILGFDLLVVASFIFVLIIFISSIGLLNYHTTLISQNLTTNEHQNWPRYGYLKDSEGQYSNPFNKGSFCANFLSRVQFFDFNDEEFSDHKQNLLNVDAV